ncbi:glycosyltransferase involved in cell wall biosynthesis [Micromonospora kangleipakensis]|uniref:Glycosyltransferase involved in cell wall biosynthesis n=1 Tax=Micromonospora kangleipakensis TaxID=1077942 RepID=A0A4Q8B7T4_9ACTN|nr:glycosyltransferase [Micromonospora kangleipakensis]RZU73744.1 glycosyltransferase involved in cell wall biosynthesis [Micromonospora kangleipakensis]
MNQPLFISWKRYQRRSDVLAEALGAEMVWRPHRATSKVLRPSDYLAHSREDLALIRSRRPSFVIAQTQPHLPGLAPYLAKVPYVIDAHNGQFQSWWRKVPGTERILRGAQLVLTHNREADAMAREAFPGLRTLVVHDPLREMAPAAPRDWVFVVATAAPDEPMDVLVDVIEAMPSVTFATTAPLHKLPEPLRERAARLPNLRTLGFLDLPDYEAALAGARAVVVLTDREGCQPSGACEALSAARPLVLSRTGTTEELFGSFATLVPNESAALAAGVREALADDRGRPARIAAARAQWSVRTAAELAELASFLPTGATR